MNNQEGLEFIRKYFEELFSKRNIDCLDLYLDEQYSDDDIGDAQANHKENSKKFLAEWFRKQPTIGVDVIDAMAQDNVITAVLHWFVLESNVKRIVKKGVAVFVLNQRKILRRHTYLYFDGE